MANRWLAFGDMVNTARARLDGLLSIRPLVQRQMILLVKELSCSGSKTYTRSEADNHIETNRSGLYNLNKAPSRCGTDYD